MLAILSFLVYALSLGLYFRRPGSAWLRTPLRRYASGAAAMAQVVVPDAIEAAGRFTRYLLIASTLYLALVIMAVAMGNPWFMFGVFILGLVPAWLASVTLYILSHPVAAAAKQLQDKGSRGWSAVPAVFPLPDAINPAKATGWAKQALNTLWSAGFITLNGGYMAFSLPLKLIPGALWCIGVVLETAEKGIRRLVAILAGVTLVLEGLAAWALFDIWFGFGVMDPLVLLLLTFLAMIFITTGIYAVTTEAPPANAQSTARVIPSTLPHLYRIVVILPLLLILFARIDPRISSGLGGIMANLHNLAAKTTNAFRLGGESIPHAYAEALAEIPTQYERITDPKGEVIGWRKVADSKVEAGTKGVYAAADAHAELRKTRRPMVQICWVSSADPDLVEVDSRLGDCKWVPKDLVKPIVTEFPSGTDASGSGSFFSYAPIWFWGAALIPLTLIITGVRGHKGHRNWILIGIATAFLIILIGFVEKMRQDSLPGRPSVSSITSASAATLPAGYTLPTGFTPLPITANSVPFVARAAAASGVPQPLIAAICLHESGCRLDVPNGDMGEVCAMQIMPATARAFGSDPAAMAYNASLPPDNPSNIAAADACFNTAAKILKIHMATYASSPDPLQHTILAYNYPLAADSFKSVRWEDVPKDRLRGTNRNAAGRPVPYDAGAYTESILSSLTRVGSSTPVIPPAPSVLAAGAPLPLITPAFQGKILAQYTWTDAGVKLKKGQGFEVRATGRFEVPFYYDSQHNGGGVQPIGINGSDPFTDNRPAGAVPAMALMARVGDGNPFFIGPAFKGTAAQGGRLLLGVNMYVTRENRGGWDVQVWTF